MERLCKGLSIIVFIVMLFFVLGCGKSPAPYQPPADCLDENGNVTESVILDRFEDPRRVGGGIRLITAVAVIETDCTECIADVIDALQTAENLLEADATWYELGIYLNGMFGFLEDKYGILIVTAGQFVDDMVLPAYQGVIPQCDRVLLRKCINDNLAILKAAL